MIADLKPYPSMKDSVLPWCPQVPSHWELKPNRAFLRQRKVLVGDRHPDYTLLSLTKKGVIVRDLTDNKGKFSSDMGTSQEVRRGDLVMCLFDVPETPRTIGLSLHDGMITGAYTVFDVCDVDAAQWLEKFYISMDDRKALSPLYSGLRNTIQKPRFLGTKTPMPPPAEQVAIVRYLDHVDRRVRRLVRTKRELIALLTEQKQAMIHRAVTRGLDPNVPLKNSGVEWLGDIPRHWRIVRNMALFAHRVEAGLPGLPVLQVSLRSGITAEGLDQFGRPKKLISDPAKYKRIYKGDIAYNTMRMWQGAVGVSPSDGLVSPAYVVLSPRGDACPNFYDFLFHTHVYKQEVNRQSTGIVSDRNRLYWDNFKQMPNIAMPRFEQEAIVDHLTAATAGADSAIDRAQREIDLLGEYRTRVIADVVTGKLDVREAATALPEVNLIDTADDLDDVFDPDAERDLDSLDAIVEETDA